MVKCPICSAELEKKSLSGRGEWWHCYNWHSFKNAGQCPAKLYLGVTCKARLLESVSGETKGNQYCIKGHVFQVADLSSIIGEVPEVPTADSSEEEAIDYAMSLFKKHEDRGYVYNALFSRYRNKLSSAQIDYVLRDAYSRFKAVRNTEYAYVNYQNALSVAKEMLNEGKDRGTVYNELVKGYSKVLTRERLDNVLREALSQVGETNQPISYSKKYRSCPKSSKHPLNRRSFESLKDKSKWDRYVASLWHKDRSMELVGVDAQTGKELYRCTICGYEKLYGGGTYDNLRGLLHMPKVGLPEIGKVKIKTLFADLPNLLMAALGLFLFSIELNSFGGGNYKGSYVWFMAGGFVLVAAAFIAKHAEGQEGEKLEKFSNLKKAVIGRYYSSDDEEEPEEDKTKTEPSKAKSKAPSYGGRTATNPPTQDEIDEQNSRGHV